VPANVGCSEKEVVKWVYFVQQITMQSTKGVDDVFMSGRKIPATKHIE